MVLKKGLPEQSFSLFIMLLSRTSFSQLIALVYEAEYHAFFKRTVQRQAYPVLLVHVISRKSSPLAEKHLPDSRSTLHIQYVDASVTGKSQRFPRYVHNDAIPPVIAFMPYDSGIGSFCPEVFRLSAVLLRDIGKYRISHFLYMFNAAHSGLIQTAWGDVGIAPCFFSILI